MTQHFEKAPIHWGTVSDSGPWSRRHVSESVGRRPERGRNWLKTISLQ